MKISDEFVRGGLFVYQKTNKKVLGSRNHLAHGMVAWLLDFDFSIASHFIFWSTIVQRYSLTVREKAE